MQAEFDPLTGDKRALASRRGFLRSAAAAGLALGPLPGVQAALGSSEAGFAGADRCLLISLTGGPAQLDTWDPKPGAPLEIRGPLSAIATSVPGIQVSERFPEMARRMHRLALVRTLHHQGSTLHDVGLLRLHTGCDPQAGPASPSIGAVVSRHDQIQQGHLVPAIVLPGGEVRTGGGHPNGPAAGWLGPAYQPRRFRSARLPVSGPATVDGLLQAAHEALNRTTARVITVQLHETLYGRETWDVHGAAPFTTMDGFRDRVAPAFDTAFCRLLDQLDQSGRLERTLVVAAGEFGRTPRLNAQGGRGHHTGCWTVILAGGPVQGGRVIGRSDAHGAAPADRPVAPAELTATIYHALGIRPDRLATDPDRQVISALSSGVSPIGELF